MVVDARRLGSVTGVTRMLVVRHGQSEWNALGRWQGQEDPPLTDLGRMQARVAAGRIGSVDLVVASDLQRAVETASIIAADLGVGPVVVHEGLRERHAGEWQGLTKDDIERDWPGYLDQRRRPPGFEATDPFTERVTAALDHLAHVHAGAEILVVSHGGVIYVIEEHHGQQFERIPNLGGRHLTHHGPDRGITLGERMILVDDDDLATLPQQL
jgi:broad specificity phosphatase PhoE